MLHYPYVYVTILHYNKRIKNYDMYFFFSDFQKYAVEALVHSASKKDRCSGVIKQATPILKELYQSANDYIKVRALVVSEEGVREDGAMIIQWSFIPTICLHISLFHRSSNK